VRDRQGLASPMLFAPVPSGIGSETAPGGELVFSALLCGERGDTTDALQNVAERLFGFTGNRNNALGSLNGTIENMISYVLGPYSRFLDKEKGCTYATDVPGAVKNVSSLNPLEIAVLNDNRTMLLERALPVYEYVLSREKLLFCADSTQDIQYPSRRMNGPCCPVSELTALSSILKDNAPYLLSFAGKEYHSTRVRNLDVVEQGGTWRNAMHLYRATGKPGYLKKAVAGADLYIRRRIDTPAAAGRNSTRSTSGTPPPSRTGIFWSIPTGKPRTTNTSSRKDMRRWTLPPNGSRHGGFRKSDSPRNPPARAPDTGVSSWPTTLRGRCGWRITRATGFWHARRTTPS
jgi:hypothetical protein